MEIYWTGVKRCYNEDARKLDYKDKFIGLLGIEDKTLAKQITKGEENMEEIVKKVEEFSDNDEIIGAYDGEWHRREVARIVMLDKIEKAAEESKQKGIEQGIEQTALNMLKEKLDINIISKVTGLNIDQIEKLKK